jgi:hypothetical protein
MDGGWKKVRVAALVCAGLGVCVPTGFGDRLTLGQSSTGPLTQQGGIPMQHSPLHDDEAQMADRQLKMSEGRNAERQKKLVEDTAKLLELATQLKADVDKTNKNILSVDVIKRAEEIEKLARSVKERMKG